MTAHQKRMMLASSKTARQFAATGDPDGARRSATLAAGWLREAVQQPSMGHEGYSRARREYNDAPVSGRVVVS